MQWKGLKVPVIILSLLAGIAFIFGAQWLHERYNYQEPINAALSENKSVESFQLITEGRQMTIRVSIWYGEDLMHSYKDIQKEISHTMGRRPFQLELVDSRNDVLKQVWYNSQYAVYQALSQGSYQDMAAVVDREAKAYDAEAKIYIDQENIYIRLTHLGHTLDEVLPRGSEQLYGNIRVPAAGGEVNAQRN